MSKISNEGVCFILIYVASAIIFYLVSNWYWYDYKKNKHEELYDMQDFFAWIALAWPVFVISIIFTKSKNK